uniref:Uncharacterized protein n=1 Tax=Cacopsylla melanoneura TaxID=428564 RepID=A0A8D9EAD8_9HEMI
MTKPLKSSDHVYRKQVKYLSNGHIRTCLSKASEIFVKGLEKVTFFKFNSILPRKLCFNMENLECPNFRTIKANMILQDLFSSPVSSLNVACHETMVTQFFFKYLVLFCFLLLLLSSCGRENR